jgi:hypothetical protein
LGGSIYRGSTVVKICVENYDMLDGFINGADGTFKYFIQTSSKSFIWIEFYNSKTRNKKLHVYEQFPLINTKWTPIEKKITEILYYVPQFIYHKYITYQIYTIYVCQTKSINCH